MRDPLLFLEDIIKSLSKINRYIEGRKARETGKSCQLREPLATYRSHFEAEKADIGFGTAISGIFFMIINRIAWPDPRVQKKRYDPEMAVKDFFT